MKLKTGDTAPLFTLKDQTGKTHTLSQYLGKWVLLYFYPKDDTPGCTVEACSIRDSWGAFGSLNAVVLGVSVDSVASHAKFVEKFELPFTLLADEYKQVVKMYDVQKALGLVAARNSFLIDPTGKIAKVYEAVKPEQHAAEVLADIRELQKSR
ncbi:peroxiredoxin [Candidatus Wirthbacteria bacterium CG2_30_54_11]|uniref:thioredoxin-dependent peroxiredoxin n=1 Tax=Candidatus Wirthbacteria bacterium CG2_30_54_11 TaxID=1817892 RepID=A0A1J5ITC3_9BACT|nr:MAG: peroxiredoxin [Candidatus Wirthbacteria bacterium CG2_30_54_11]